MPFATLQETMFQSAIAAVRSYRERRNEPLAGALTIPAEFVGIPYVVAVEYTTGESAKLYTVIRANERGLSVIDSALVRGIRAGGPADAALLADLLATPGDGIYAPAVAHIRSEIGTIVDVVALRDHFYRVEGSAGAELCYALYDDNARISGLSFGPTVGEAERAFSRERLIGVAPLDCTFQVIWGGRRATGNHHFSSREQRYAVDVEPPIGWTARVLAICDGVITHVEDTYPDLGSAHLDTVTSRFGNHAIVRTRRHEIVYAHMRRGSVIVRVGERVKPGETIGEVGNSGHSTRPHLHVHARTPTQHQGVPLYFRLGGDVRELERGEIVAADAPRRLEKALSGE